MLGTPRAPEAPSRRDRHPRRQGKIRDDAQPHDVLGLIELSHRLMHGVAEF